MPMLYRGEPHVLYAARDITERRAAEAAARRARAPAAPGAEDGGDRPAHRRHRARLQQHPDQRHRLSRPGAGARRDVRRRAAAAPARPGAARGAARARPDRADAGLRAAPARRAPHRWPWRRWSGRRCSCCGRRCRRRWRSISHGARPTADGRRWPPTPVQLEQVLFNLCINARDAIQRAGLHPRARRPARAAAGIARRAGQPVESGRWVELERRRQRLRHAGRGAWSASSSRSSRPRKSAAAPAWAWRWCTASCTTTAATSLVETAPGAGSVFRVLLPAARARRAGGRGAPAPAPPAHGEAAARPRAAGRRRGHGRRLHGRAADRLGARGGAASATRSRRCAWLEDGAQRVRPADHRPDHAAA